MRQTLASGRSRSSALSGCLQDVKEVCTLAARQTHEYIKKSAPRGAHNEIHLLLRDQRSGIFCTDQTVNGFERTWSRSLPPAVRLRLCRYGSTIPRIARLENLFPVQNLSERPRPPQSQLPDRTTKRAQIACLVKSSGEQKLCVILQTVQIAQ